MQWLVLGEVVGCNKCVWCVCVGGGCEMSVYSNWCSGWGWVGKVGVGIVSGHSKWVQWLGVNEMGG